MSHGHSSSIFVQDLVDLLRGQILVEVIIHLYSRSPTACPDALDFLQREYAVRRRAFVSDAQPRLAVIEKLLTTAQHARDVGANLDVEFAARFRGQHGVVADYVAYLEVGQIQALRNLMNYVMV